MKKAWKWLLGVLGGILLTLALIVGDSIRRAANTIELHEAKLSREIADSRARLQSLPPPALPNLSPEEMERIPCPPSRHGEVDFEAGQTPFHERSIEMNGHRMQLMRGYGVAPEWTIDRALAALAVTIRTFREGGYILQNLRASYEEEILGSLRWAAGRPEVSSAELKEVQVRLDELLATRVPFKEFVTGEHLLDRAELLRVKAAGSDPRGMLLAPPGWREAFSWRILIAKSLNQLEEHRQDFREPAPEDVFAEMNSNSSYAALGLGPVPRSRPLTDSNLLRNCRPMVQIERYTLASWQAARLTMAILRFEGDKGRKLVDLAALVPEYLPELPLSPLGNKAFSYRNGDLRTPHPGFSWPVRVTR